MNIKDVIAKALKGEKLTEEERTFAGSYDPQRDIDTAAGSARRKAEADAKTAKDALDTLRAEYDAYREANDPEKVRARIEELTRNAERIEAETRDIETHIAELTRQARIRSLAQDAHLAPAKDVDGATFDLLVDHVLHDVDLEDAGAVKTAFDGFKASNAGLIAAQGIGGVGVKGTPGGSGFIPDNPFSKENFNLTRQLGLKEANPAMYNMCKSAAGR